MRNAGFRASGLGDDAISIHITSMDEFIENTPACGAGANHDINAGLFYKDLNWSRYKLDVFRGFRAPPESHSFFTFGTIY